METKDLRWTKLTNHERESILRWLKAFEPVDRVPMDAAIEALQAIVETP